MDVKLNPLLINMDGALKTSRYLGLSHDCCSECPHGTPGSLLRDVQLCTQFSLAYKANPFIHLLFTQEIEVTVICFHYKQGI